jgi:transposase
MSNCIIVGADVHDVNCVLQVALDKGAPEQMTFAMHRTGRQQMIAALQAKAQAAAASRIVLVYEASGLGFGLYDDLRAAGIECFVLAPTKIVRSQHERKRKCDAADALALLNSARGHVLAGNALPVVWVPSLQLREDREIVRAYRENSTQITRCKTQIRCLLKRHPLSIGKRNWSKGFMLQLRMLTMDEAQPFGLRSALASMLRQLESRLAEEKHLADDIRRLSQLERYTESCAVLQAETGVGLLTAMVFLTEIGDMLRFRNRREVGCYIGLTPASYDSGETRRSGHITRQGSYRLRRVLCQAAWARLRLVPAEKAAYERICGRNPKYKKIAVVALMRRLAVRMWHLAVNVQQRRHTA